METRFVPETTTSPDHVVWTLYEGDRIVASVLTRPGLTKDEAMLALERKMVADMRILSSIQSLTQDE